jgi:hypothetical protein
VAALLRCAVVLVVGALLALACGSSSAGPPTCSAAQTCTQAGGQICRKSCMGVDDAGSWVPVQSDCSGGDLCTSTSECCEGTACAARAVYVCCPPSGC